jgi:hypothetical protein
MLLPVVFPNVHATHADRVRLLESGDVRLGL